MLLTSASASAQQIATDKLNYQPGEVVKVIGWGWRASESVTLTINDTYLQNPQVQINVVAGADGRFTNLSFVTRTVDQNHMLVMSAVGAASGATAVTAFEDGVGTGKLYCPNLTNYNPTHYRLERGKTASCFIQDAGSLATPTQVLIKSSTLGNTAAAVKSVSGSQIAFDFTAPSSACDTSIVSYGPLTVTDPKTLKSTTFPAEGNNSNNFYLGGGASAAGFAFVDAQGNGVTCGTPPKLLLSKVADKPAVGPGDAIGFTITLQNNGPGTASGLLLTDLLPRGEPANAEYAVAWAIDFMSGAACTLDGNVSDQRLNCPNITLEEGKSVTVHVTALTGPEACGTYSNMAELKDASSLLIGQAFATTVCTRVPKLTITKTADKATVSPGDSIGFTISVKNTGTGVANGLTISDLLPANTATPWQVEYASLITCAIAGNQLSCGPMSLGIDDTAWVHVKSTTSAAACGVYNNTASFSSTNGGAGQASASINCGGGTPGVTITKTPDKSPVTAGEPVGFTIVVKNNGPGTATGVRLSDTLPTGTAGPWTYDSAAGATCAISGQQLTCGPADLAAGATISVHVKSTTSAAACGCYTNTATFTTTSGTSGQAAATVQCNAPPAQLKVEKTPDNGVFTQGSQISFTISVSNPAPAGAASAKNVALTDALPTNGGLSWASAATTQGACSVGNNVLTCSLGDIAPQASVTVTVTSTATTPPEACQLQSNVAKATADGGLTAQDSGSQSCTPPGALLKVDKTPDNGSFTQGSPISFTIVVSNPAAAGAASAKNVTLADALPTNGGLSWASATTTKGTCSVANNVLNCSLGDIAPQISVTVTVTSIATTPPAACQSQPNVAKATADGGLTAQDSGSQTCTPPQLKVEKTPDNGTFTQGAQVSYTIVVSNPAVSGASPAKNVQLKDTLPTNGGLSWTSATATQGSCSIAGNLLNCSLGDIAPQANVTVVVRSPATTPLDACQSQPNPVAAATADGGLTAQDSGSQSCTPPGASLKVEKTPDNGVFTQGSQISFTIVVSNPAAAGSASAKNVTLTDALPTNGGLSWASATTTKGTCSVANNVLNCSLGDIAPQTSVTITVTSTATTPPAACQLQSNLAKATADGGLTAQDSGSQTCTPPQLKVEKTPDNGTFTQGAQVSYTIVVSNPAVSGASPAKNVQLKDTLPTNGGLSWTSATATQGSCSITGNLLNCSLGDIAPQASVTVVVRSPATTPLDACQSQPNPVAAATADGGLTAQDSGSQSCTPPGASLKLEKTPDNGVFTQGSQVSFTIVVSNPAAAGSASAKNVTLTDALPTNGGLSWANATTTQGTCSVASNMLNCSLGDIAPQASVTVTVTSTATTPPAACQLQSNLAKATADGGLTAQDSGSQTCTPPQLKVDKTPDNGTFTQGSQISYTIVVSNPAAAGASPAKNVQLKDTLPTNGNLVWQNVSTSQGTCGLSGNALSCGLGDIPAQGSVRVVVTSTPTTPPEACQSQPNPVALATADGGLTAQNDGSQSCTPPVAQLRVAKTPDNGVFAAGSQVSFTIVVSNPAPAGAATAKNVTLADTLPINGGLSWASATSTQGSCTLAGNGLTCTLGDIAPQRSVTVLVTSTPTTPAAACQVQSNPVALATADGGLTAQDSGSLICTPAPVPGIAITKTANPATAAPGQSVTFTYVVTNTGNITLNNIAVTDDNGTPNVPADDFTVGTIASLAPGASATLTNTRIPSRVGILPTLGSAGPGKFAVLSLGGDSSHPKAGINCSNATVNGNVGVPSYGAFSNAAPCTENGTFYKGTNVTYSGPGKLNGPTVTDEARLNTVRTQAFNAATYFAGLPETPAVKAQFPSSGSIGGTVTVTGTPGLNVVNLNNFRLDGNLVLTGPAGTQFVINVGGTFDLHSGNITASGGVGTYDVVYNITKAGASVKTMVPTTAVGVLLAPYNAISAMDSSNFYGSIIGGYNQVITLMSGTKVVPPPPPPPNVTNTATATVTVAGSTLTAQTTATVTIQ